MSGADCVIFNTAIGHRADDRELRPTLKIPQLALANGLGDRDIPVMPDGVTRRATFAALFGGLSALLPHRYSGDNGNPGGAGNADGALDPLSDIIGATTKSAQDTPGRTAIHPEQFGAVGDGVTDDTAAWRKTLAAGKYIQAKRGAVYHTTATLGAPLDGALIDLNGAKIIGDWEQATTVGDPAARYEAIIYMEGRNNVTIRNGEIAYVGTFDYNFASYRGLVSCIHANGCDNLTIENCEIHGGNRAGILIGAAMNQKENAAIPYSSSPRVLNCDVHHCRVGGVIFGRTENGLCQGNQLRFCGHPKDIGTGYGFAGYSTGVPKNTSLIGNHALDNYRKGLDFHSGMNGVVSDNIVLRNRCDGIYVMGVSGSWTITGNVIADMLWTGEFDIPMYAMRFGELRGQGKHDIPTSFNVTGNTISNFRMTGGVAVFPILLGGQGLSYGKFNISNNILQLGRVTKILECQPRVKRAAGNYFDVSFDSNQIYCSEVVEVPFTIRGTFNRKKSFSNNQIEIAVAHGTADIFSYDNTSVANNSLVANSNDFTVPTGSFASDIIHIKRTGKEVMLGNIVNGSPWRDWDGIKFIAAGSSAKPPSDMRMWTVGSAWQTTKVGAGGSPGAICTKAGLVAPAWTGKTAYSKVGQLVANDTGKIYKLIKAGRSASSGGPKGRAASGIADGSCVWGYVGVLAVFKVLPAIAA